MRVGVILSAVADGDIQFTIRTEMDVAAVVIARVGRNVVQENLFFLCRDIAGPFEARNAVLGTPAIIFRARAGRVK